MVDQSHNLKPKIEAMIQTVMTAQELWAKAALVDHRKLKPLQDKGDIVGAENLLKDAFSTDVRPGSRPGARRRAWPRIPWSPSARAATKSRRPGNAPGAARNWASSRAAVTPEEEENGNP